MDNKNWNQAHFVNCFPQRVSRSKPQNQALIHILAIGISALLHKLNILPMYITILYVYRYLCTISLLFYLFLSLYPYIIYCHCRQKSTQSYLPNGFLGLGIMATSHQHIFMHKYCFIVWISPFL